VLISGKVVLITGASRGIGAACADAFARRSAVLSLTARSAFERGDALITAADITKPTDRSRIVEATLERFGRIDILINNAGQGSYRSALDPSIESEEEARRLFDLNFFAPLALTQLVVPHMRAAGSGMIVNVGSIAGKVALPWMPIYSATKFALGALTSAVRTEVARDSIRAMQVCPGYVNTPFHEHAIGKPPSAVAGAKPFAISPRHCAEAIARGVERDARTVVTPSFGWFFIWIERLFPTLVDSRLSRIAK
jgi:short-subunit dehydrogenase